MKDEERKLVRGKDLDKISEYFKNFPVPEEFSLDSSYHNVMMLLEFMEIIDKEAKQLKYPLSARTLKEGFSPSATLFPYIILEISNFYTKAHLMKKKGAKFPDIPEYWKILKEYRNAGPGHQDKEHRFKTLADGIIPLKKIEFLGPVRIVEDFQKYYLEVKKSQTKQ